jgi:hypothetical protein
VRWLRWKSTNTSRNERNSKPLSLPTRRRPNSTVSVSVAISACWSIPGVDLYDGYDAPCCSPARLGASSLKRQLARALAQVEEYKHVSERTKLEAAIAADFCGDFGMLVNPRSRLVRRLRRTLLQSCQARRALQTNGSLRVRWLRWKSTNTSRNERNSKPLSLPTRRRPRASCRFREDVSVSVAISACWSIPGVDLYDGYDARQTPC